MLRSKWPAARVYGVINLVIPVFLIGFVVTGGANIYSHVYIQRRIRQIESTGLPGAAEEAARLRAKLRRPSFADWRGAMFMYRDVGRRTLHSSYRLGRSVNLIRTRCASSNNSTIQHMPSGF